MHVNRLGSNSVISSFLLEDIGAVPSSSFLPLAEEIAGLPALLELGCGALPEGSLHKLHPCRVVNRGDSQGAINEDLRKACERGDKEKAKVLIKRGADALAKIRDDYPALSFVSDAEMALIVNRMEGAKAFKGCKSLHDFYRVLFPVKTEVSDNYSFPEWMPKISFFNEENTKLFSSREGYPISENLEGLLPVEPSLQTILTFLLKAPFFREVWLAAGQPKIEEVPDDFFIDFNGKREFAHGQGADYDTNAHTIHISKLCSPLNKIKNLIFEALNAIQKCRFLALDEQAKAGKLGREDYVLIVERIEYDTVIWYQKLLKLFNFAKEADESFSANWKRVQIPFVKDGVSHADEYRENWDICFGSHYLRENPDLLQAFRGSAQNPPPSG